jgi:NADH-quinone oxidoreductase subunit H
VAFGVIAFGALFLLPPVNEMLISPFWFFLKVGAIVYTLIWFRGTFPRFRYDQLMNVGWKVLIPLALVSILANAVVGLLRA